MPSRVILRVVQFVAHSLAAVFALGTFIPLGQLLYRYDYRCVLNSHLSVRVVVNGTSSVYIDADGSEWGDRGVCLFTIFLAVFVAIHAFVWGWFYIHLMRTLREAGREMALFVPVFICHALLFVCAFVSSIFLSESSGKVCPAIRFLTSQKFSCSELNDMTWHTDLSPTLNSLPPFSRLIVAQVSSWLMTAMVAVPCGVAVYHLFVSAPVVYEVTPHGVDGPLAENEGLTDFPKGDLSSSRPHDKSNGGTDDDRSYDDRSYNGRSFDDRSLSKSNDRNRLV